MPFPRPGIYSKPTWSVGRKIGAVLAFVIGGAVAGASGIMLFAPETPGAFALAPLPAANEPVLPTVVAVAPAETVPAPGAEGVNLCRGDVPKCEADIKAESSAAVPGDRKPEEVRATAAPVQGEAAKPVTAAKVPETSPPAGKPPKSADEAALNTDFLVPRPIASVTPQLAVAFTAATVPAMFLASRQIAATSYPLVSPALPALAARPKPVTTTAVALPAAAEEAKPAPAKQRKTTQRRSNRNYANDYRRQQNFFSFFWR